MKYRKGTVELCDAISSNKDFRKHVQEHKYDVLVVMTILERCSLITVLHHQKNIPFVVMVPTIHGSWMQALITGIPDFTVSYVPILLLPFTEQMSFVQRLQNFLWYQGLRLTIHWYKLMSQPVLTKNLGAGHLSPTEVIKDAALTIVNTNFEYDYPIPTTPDYIFAGCLQCREGRPLSSELKNFIEGAGKHGVIVFSLGSLLSNNIVQEETLTAFMEAFKTLPQRVIWHSDLALQDMPDNVMMKKWIPLQDVLADANTKAIISHGGMLSLQETCYHGVPYLGFPIFPVASDRLRNVALAKYRGMGLTLHENNLSKEIIVDALHQLIYDPKFKRNAMKISELMKDQLVTPKDRVVFMIEQIVQTGGAKHLKSIARNLSTVQFYMIDVLFTLAVLLLITLFSIYYATILLVRTFKIVMNKMKAKKE